MADCPNTLLAAFSRLGRPFPPIFLAVEYELDSGQSVEWISTPISTLISTEDRISSRTKFPLAFVLDQLFSSNLGD